eukprot:6172652-Prymnesium_polylepis.1
MLKHPGVSLRGVSMVSLYLGCSTNALLLSSILLGMEDRQQKAASTSRIDESTIHSIYRWGLKRPFNSTCRALRIILEASRSTQPHDVFFWLTFQGNLEAAEVIWPMCNVPVHVALLGSAVARKLAGAFMEELRDNDARNAESCASAMEQWAIGAIEMASSEDEAHTILSLPVSGREDIDAIGVALETNAKHFLSQRHCISLVDYWWRGGSPGSKFALPRMFSWPILILTALCPLHILIPQKREEKQEGANYTTDMLISILAHFMRTAELEYGKVAAKLKADSMDGSSPDSTSSQWLPEAATHKRASFTAPAMLLERKCSHDGDLMTTEGSVKGRCPADGKGQETSEERSFLTDHSSKERASAFAGKVPGSFKALNERSSTDLLEVAVSSSRHTSNTSSEQLQVAEKAGPRRMSIHPALRNA